MFKQLLATLILCGFLMQPALADSAGLAEPDPFAEQEIQTQSDAYVDWENQVHKPPSKLHKVIHFVGKWSTLPVFFVCGWGVGHVLGGPVGMLTGIGVWDEAWDDE